MNIQPRRISGPLLGNYEKIGRYVYHKKDLEDVDGTSCVLACRRKGGYWLLGIRVGIVKFHDFFQRYRNTLELAKEQNPNGVEHPFPTSAIDVSPGNNGRKDWISSGYFTRPIMDKLLRFPDSQMFVAIPFRMSCYKTQSPTGLHDKQTLWKLGGLTLSLTSAVWPDPSHYGNQFKPNSICLNWEKAELTLIFSMTCTCPEFVV